jgi:MATE family multidrug resistance protein
MLRAHRPERSDRSAVWQLAWPMIVSNVSVPLLGLVDAAILGHLPDARYLAAVAVATSLFGFLYWGFGFLRMGTTGLVAQRFGTPAEEPGARRARDGELRLLTAQAVLLALALSALVLVATPWLFPLGLELMAPPASAAAEADVYWRIRMWSAPAVLVTYALTGLLVGMQDTRSVLVITVATNVLNIAGDLLLVPGLGMRTEGVAIATLAAEWFGCLLAVTLARRHLARHPATLEVPALLDLDRYRELLAVNGHLFVRTMVLIGTLAFFTSQGARQGEVVLAANALLMNLLMLTSYGLDGFAHAAEALAGRHFGARDGRGFARSVGAAAQFSLITAGAFTVAFLVAGDLLIAALTDLEAVRVLARDYLPWLAVLPLIAVWCYLLDGVFIGVTATRDMRDTMLASTVLVFLPLWWATRELGNTGLWLALDAFFVARGLTLGVRYLRAARAGHWFPAQDFFGRG